jgi:hypothetical protein
VLDYNSTERPRTASSGWTAVSILLWIVAIVIGLFGSIQHASHGQSAQPFLTNCATVAAAASAAGAISAIVGMVIERRNTKPGVAATCINAGLLALIGFMWLIW